MAVSLRTVSRCILSRSALLRDCHFDSVIRAPVGRRFTVWRRQPTHGVSFGSRRPLRLMAIAGCGGVAAAGASALAYFFCSSDLRLLSCVAAAGSDAAAAHVKPSRMIRSSTDSSGLHLTLYQYQSCPFCCKVRAYLDFHGFSYDVVEVNSVTQAEIRWSKYRKVPILVCEDSDDKTLLQLNDSSLIISLLESFLQDRTLAVGKLQTFYPGIESKNSRGKTIYEYPNKYFIMHGETGNVSDDRKNERQWRQWTDDVLVHTLSPNIYRSPAESMQAFRHFSDAGEWSTRFGTLERLFIIYVGAAAMFFVGRILKKRHKLKDDVRESMYDACRQWTTAVGASGGKFMGGDQPNLADLAVYGVLSAVDGCQAFDDLVSHTDIVRWYQAVKKAVATNAGQRQTDSANLLNIPV